MIARIEARNPAINAIVLKLYDSARAAAGQTLAGPLAGVPFLLKDLSATLAGTPTSEGNRRLGAVPRGADSELVARYRQAGLIFVGKTNTPEFGLAPVTEPEAFGRCRNPWDLSRTPGGSSGGAGAAVAARIAPFAHASDGGGSIRIPASCCGLVGLKPTRGRTPSGPIEGEAWRGFSVANALTRSVRDCAALLDVVHGVDVGAPFEIKPPARPYRDEIGAPPGRLRIAFTVAPLLTDAVHPDCVAGVKATAALLADLGHEVVEATLPLDREAWLDAFTKIVAGEVAVDIQRAAGLVGRQLGRSDFEATTWVVGLLGRSFSAADYAAALRFAQRWSRQVGAFFAPYDALLTPTLAQPPLPHGALQPTAVEAAILEAIGRTGAGWFLRADRPGAPTVEEVDELHPVHAAVQRHRPAGDFAAAALERRRPADRHAIGGADGRRGDAVASRQSARAGAAVVRSRPAGLRVDALGERVPNAAIGRGDKIAVSASSSAWPARRTATPCRPARIGASKATPGLRG